MAAKGHRYLPAGETDRREMLAAIGVDQVDDLFATIPQEVRLSQPPEVTGPMGDEDLRRHFGGLAALNQVDRGKSFLGAGAYQHTIPAAVDHLLHRAEFFTVYTPYQPETSQGTLQAIFEYQTFISILTGLPVANASLYDGASACAEAVLMSLRVQRKRRRVILAGAIHPHYRETLATYTRKLCLQLVDVGSGADGRVDLADLENALDDETACVVSQSPNYFGGIEDWQAISNAADAHGAHSIGVVTEALSMGLLKSPGECGCQIAVGEAQSFGNSMSFGGPSLGFLAATDKMKRAIPGRLVGETVDVDGRRAYVLTLATREQHIRREKATSNICTNQSLCALAATIYLSLHGRTGLRELAQLNVRRLGQLRQGLTSIDGLEPAFDTPVFNEMAIRATAKPVDQVLAGFRDAGLIAGHPLADQPGMEDCFLTAATEIHTAEDVDRWLDVAKEVAS